MGRQLLRIGARSGNRISSLDVSKTNVEAESLDLDHGPMFVPYGEAERVGWGHPEVKSLRCKNQHEDRDAST